MTAIVGVLCTDGVVIGTDSSATFAAGAFHTIEQPTEKLDLIEGRILIAGTGQIGLGQRFKRIVEDSWRAKGFKGEAVEVCRSLCERTIADFASTHAPRGEYGSVIAFPIGGKFFLCEFSVKDFQPELKSNHPRLWYVTLGSAQHITDSFFGLLREILWHDSQPNVRQATFAVVWALEHACDVNAGGVKGPVQIGIIGFDGADPKARVLAPAELEEHVEAIEQAKINLKAVLRKLDSGEHDVPDVPKPADK
jgi:hypothetical protein